MSRFAEGRSGQKRQAIAYPTNRVRQTLASRAVERHASQTDLLLIDGWSRSFRWYWFGDAVMRGGVFTDNSLWRFSIILTER